MTQETSDSISHFQTLGVEKTEAMGSALMNVVDSVALSAQERIRDFHSAAQEMERQRTVDSAQQLKLQHEEFLTLKASLAPPTPGSQSAQPALPVPWALWPAIGTQPSFYYNYMTRESTYTRPPNPPPPPASPAPTAGFPSTPAQQQRPATPQQSADFRKPTAHTDTVACGHCKNVFSTSVHHTHRNSFHNHLASKARCFKSFHNAVNDTGRVTKALKLHKA